MSVGSAYGTHATSTDNEAGIATGWLPGHVSGTGRQAREMRERRRGDDLTAISTSDLARAVETAEIAFAAVNLPIFKNPRLCECNYGAVNGSLVKDVASVRIQHIDMPFPGGQSYRQVAEETRAFPRHLAEGCNGKTVLVVAHSANR